MSLYILILHISYSSQNSTLIPSNVFLLLEILVTSSPYIAIPLGVPSLPKNNNNQSISLDLLSSTTCNNPLRRNTQTIYLNIHLRY